MPVEGEKPDSADSSRKDSLKKGTFIRSQESSLCKCTAERQGPPDPEGFRRTPPSGGRSGKIGRRFSVYAPHSAFTYKSVSCAGVINFVIYFFKEETQT